MCNKNPWLDPTSADDTDIDEERWNLEWTKIKRKRSEEVSTLITLALGNHCTSPNGNTTVLDRRTKRVTEKVIESKVKGTGYADTTNTWGKDGSLARFEKNLEEDTDSPSLSASVVVV